MSNSKTITRNVGRAGILIVGYNFSLSGICSPATLSAARGGVSSACIEAIDQTPVTSSMMWNMTYDEQAPTGTVPNISH